MTGSMQTPEDERHFGRRAFLRGSVLIVGGAVVGRIPIAAAAIPSTQLNGFIELSQIVTGGDKLPRSLAHEYLDALDTVPQLKLKPSKLVDLAGYARGKGPRTLRALEHSATFTTEGARACVAAIAAAWWSGMVPTVGGGQRVV